MKNDVEGLAGYVAEWFVFYHLKANEQMHDVCPHFGTDIDKKHKTDYSWSDNNGQFKYGDCKGSIMHENISIEADHPFFKQMVRGAYFFLFPFRDKKSIAMVEAHTLYERVLTKKQLCHGTKRDYYVVSPTDVNNLNKDDIAWISVVKNCETFGNFFKKNFRGDEITGLSEKEICDYVKSEVAKICQKNIIDYDIPED